MASELKVEIKIHPHPDEVTPQEFDRIMDGELMEFEKWFVAMQRHRGNPSPSGLISAERAAVKTYVLYLSTRERSGN